MLTTAKLDVMSHCWVASLANYNFQSYYSGEDQHWHGCLVGGILAHVHAWHLGHTPLSHCSSSASHVEGCPSGPCESHWGIQLQPACIGPNKGWLAGHLYDDWWLTTGSADTPHPWSGDCEDAGWDLWLVAMQANQPTRALTAPHRMQPPQLKLGILYRKVLPRESQLPYFRWYCQLHTGRPLLKDAMMKFAT